MATLVLGVGLAAALPATASAATISIVGAIGATVGRLIDNAFLTPLLQKDKNPLGQRVDSFGVQGATEGQSWYYIVGPGFRCPGTVVWKGPHEHRTVTSGGGKGIGPSAPGISQREYYCSLAVLICDKLHGRTGDGIIKAWYNGDVFYDVTTDFSVVATDIDFQVRGVVVQGAPLQYELDVVSASINFTPETFPAGSSVTISGATGPAAPNNGTWIVKAVQNPNRLTLIADATAADENAAGQTITLAVDVPDTDSDVAFAVRPHYGSPTEAADAILVAGGGTAIGYRDRTIAVVQNLELTRTGSNIVGQFQWLIEADKAPFTVGDAIQQIIAQAEGSLPFTVDSSACTDTFRGAGFRVVQSPLDNLKELALAYDLAVQEDGDVLRFFHRRNAQQFTIPATDFAYTDEGGSGTPGRPVLFSDAAPTQRFTEVNITYYDPDQDYIEVTQRYVDNTATPAERNVTDLRLNVVLTAQEALKIAARVLFESQVATRAARFTLGPKWSKLLPSDVVNVDLNAPGGGTRSHSLFLTEVVVGFNGLVECTAIEHDSDILTLLESEVSAQSTTSITSLAPPAPLRLELLDVSSLSYLDVTTPSLYFAVANYDAAAAFRTGQLWVSTDGVNYTFAKTFVAETAMGTAETELGDTNVAEGYIDSINSVDVELDHGQLISISEAEMIAGSNIAILNNEVIAFKTATQLTTVNPGKNRYRLSGLLRNLYGTYAMNGINQATNHAVGDRFVLLNQIGITKEEVDITARGTTRYYKAVPEGGSLGAATAFAFGVWTRNVEPFAPTNFRWKNITDPVLGAGTNLKWSKVSRRPPPYPYSPASIPVAESVEFYEVRVSNTQGGTVLLQAITSGPEVFFTTSLRTSFGINDNFWIEIAQVSDYLGPSPRFLTVNLDVSAANQSPEYY